VRPHRHRRAADGSTPTPIRRLWSTPWHGSRTRSADAATKTAPHHQGTLSPRGAAGTIHAYAGVRHGLYTADGARKYLTAGERQVFLRAAERADREPRTLCMTLAYGGCRPSEALALTADRVDLAGGLFESVRNAAAASTAPCWCRPRCSTRSTWCTASASSRAGAGWAAASVSGHRAA
jgi:integrase